MTRRRRSAAISPRQALRKVREIRAHLDQKIDLRGLRDSVGLSQERAARLANVSTRTWYDWENHNSVPRADRVQAVCAFVAEVASKGEEVSIDKGPPKRGGRGGA